MTIVSSNYLFSSNTTIKKKRRQSSYQWNQISAPKLKLPTCLLMFKIWRWNCVSHPLFLKPLKEQSGFQTFVLPNLSSKFCRFFFFSFPPIQQLPSVWVQWSVIWSRIAQVHLLHIRTGTAACSIAWCQGCVEDDWRLRAGRTCSSLRCAGGDRDPCDAHRVVTHVLPQLRHLRSSESEATRSKGGPSKGRRLSHFCFTFQSIFLSPSLDLRTDGRSRSRPV